MRLPFTLPPRALRWATLASLVTSILIVLGGAAVRITGSGLGCPTWPTCTGDSLGATRELGLHGAIEYANRQLTGVLVVAVGAVIVTALLQERRDGAAVRAALAQFLIVVLNAVIGGITVLTGLNPYIVAVHLLAALLLLTAAAVSYDLAWRPRDDAGRPVRVPPPGRPVRLTVGATVLLVVLGTVVTGAGPHPGSSSEVHRIGVDWTTVATLHGVAALGVIALVARCVTVLGGTARRRAAVLLGLLLGQAALGLYQSVTGLPGGAVVAHLLLAALIWVGAVRLWLAGDPARTSVPQDASIAALP